MERVVTVIGGGLAGLSLGIALRSRGVPVVLHEAGSYPRHRVCGEFISGVREETLAALGIADLFGDAHVHRKTAWYRNDREFFSGEIPSSALGISRHTLDLRLSRKFQGIGGQLIDHSRQKPSETAGAVWCAGRRPVKGSWIGLKCHVRNLSLLADLEMHLGGNGYVGIACIEQDKANLCGLFRLTDGLAGRGVDTLRRYLNAGGLDALWRRVESAGIEEASFLGVSGFRLGWTPARRGMISLGDAEGMIPPFSGNGMSMAFEAAEMAVEPLLRWYEGAQTWENTLRETSVKVRARFRPRMLAARVMHPFLTRRGGQGFFAAVSQSGLLPFNLCFRVLRHS